MNQNNTLETTGRIFQKRIQLFDVEFEHDKIMTGPLDINHSFTEVDVRVPPNCWLVSTQPVNGRKIIIPSGVQPIGRWLPWGCHQVFLVSQQTQITSSKERKFTTADGLYVSLTPSLAWHVDNPTLILNLTKPSDWLENMFVNSVAATVQKHKHDDLIGINATPKTLVSELTKEICDYFVNFNCAQYGIKVNQITINDLHGDERWVNPQVEACTQKVVLNSALDTFDLKAKINKKEALSKLDIASIDQKINTILSQGAISAKDLEFRRNFLYKLIEILPELQKTQQTGFPNSTTFSTTEAISIGILDLIKMLSQTPTSIEEYPSLFQPKPTNDNE